MFPYAFSPHHERAKWDTIGVAKKTSAKLPHCIGPMVVNPLKKETPLVHHTIKWWGCDYIIEDDKRLKWKDLKPSNVETHVQVDVGGVGVRERIELRWSQGFGLDELDV